MYFIFDKQSPHTSSSNLTTFAWALLSAWSLISMCLLWSSVVDRSVFNSISSFSFSRSVSLSEYPQFPPQNKCPLLFESGRMLHLHTCTLKLWIMRPCLGEWGVLTLCKQLGDGFTVVLCVITLFSSKLLVGCLHALFKRTKVWRKHTKIVHSQKEHKEV